ncbi:MAG: HD domain-containing protein [Chloroflexi bacterium]|nr:HD domain-containing protein [Chloroflexota bacterium]
MVRIQNVEIVRPQLIDELHLSPFKPRTEAIAEAYRLGAKLHAGQERLSGEPFFETHCVWIANFLEHLVKKEAWTIAALLHDTVEDRGGSLELIRQTFPGDLGEEVAYIVDGVTKLSVSRTGRSRQMETLRKIAMFRDPGVFLVKLADKTHNVMTLEYMEDPKRRQKADEAIRAYGRLAGILNCYKWRHWLEDMAFPYAYPEIYRVVRRQIDRDPRLSLEFINSFIRQLGSVMEKSGIDGSIEINVNGYWSAWQKLKRMSVMRRSSLNTFESVNDLISFRMVVDENDYRLCYSLLADVNRFLGPYLNQDRFDDYIACPQNGYRALQATAWLQNLGAVEVAISTRDMEDENQWGFVYAVNQGRSTENYQTVEIITPTGGVRFVPEGSTVLDAIAAIQQDLLLDKISSVRVNDNMARLWDKVHPGDVVEVITEGNHIPVSEEWLQFCSRTTARLVRHLLANQALKMSAVQGRQQIKILLLDRGILSLEDVLALAPERIENLLSQLSSPGLEDLYSAVGGGAIAPEEISAALDEAGISKQKLNWTTIHLLGKVDTNKPGMLAMFASLISIAGANIMRVVNDTMDDGSFDITFVAQGLTEEQEKELNGSFQMHSGELRYLEIV